MERVEAPSAIEFSASQIWLVNDGTEQQRSVYQLQNRCTSSRRVRAAISKDSNTVSIYYKLLSMILGCELKFHPLYLEIIAIKAGG